MIDLHTHSTYSDGTVTPTELIALCKQAEITSVALCDHNTVCGLPEFLDAARKQNIDAIPGVEFSTEYNGTELHILGLFIPPEHYKTVTELLDEMLEEKERSNCELIKALDHIGIQLNYNVIQANHPDGLINRAVIAAEMVRLGYVNSVKDAFSNYLSEKHGLYHPPRRLGSLDTIQFIRSIGAVSVLAHPFLDLDELGLRGFLRDATKVGLDGMETRYAKYDDATSRLATEIASEFGILESGGSDFHGANKPDIQLGIGRGSLRVPYEFLNLLRLRSTHARNQIISPLH